MLGGWTLARFCVLWGVVLGARTAARFCVRWGEALGAVATVAQHCQLRLAGTAHNLAEAKAHGAALQRGHLTGARVFTSSQSFEIGCCKLWL